MGKEEVDEMPLYLAYILMGAISPDMVSLRLSERDRGFYLAALAKKRTERGQ
jgi:hypothetical protein